MTSTRRKRRSPPPPGQAGRRGHRGPSRRPATAKAALEGFRTLARNRRMLFWLIGTAGAWAMLDFAYYGNTISSPEVLKVINPHGSLLHNTLLQLLIFAVFALPGYALAIRLLDRSGRKKIQCSRLRHDGTRASCSSASCPGSRPRWRPLSSSSGRATSSPSSARTRRPSSIRPRSSRWTCGRPGTAISAAAGKLGAFAGAYLFPDMLASSWGLRGAEVVAGRRLPGRARRCRRGSSPSPRG